MLKINDAEFNEMTAYLKKFYGINLANKKALVEGRLSNTLSDKGFTSYGDYFKNVVNDKSGKEMALLINKLTTNHTYFMREVEHFNYFKSTVLPKIIQNSKDKDMRIWSAGCSSGEEPYTLQMIIQDVLGSQRSGWDTKLLATDISQRALMLAKNGIYSNESITEIPDTWKRNYFKKIDATSFQVADSVRNEVIFRTLNLMNDFKFKRKFQVIFCRNVMIYFDKETKEKLVNKFYDVTEPGGYLFIGHSESINKEATKFKYVMPAVYQKGF